MEVAGFCELLSDQGRTDHLPIVLDQAALGLAREEDLGHAGRKERVGKTRYEDEERRRDERGPE